MSRAPRIDRSGGRRTPRRLPRASLLAAVTGLLVVAAALVVGAGSAGAYVLEGKPWPGRVITYHNDIPADAAAIKAAVRDWNTSGVGIRFVPAPASRAEVTIAAMPSGSSGGGSTNGPSAFGADILGYATVGMVPRSTPVSGPSGAGQYQGAHVWLLRVGSHDAAGLTVSLSLMKRVAAHELGHVLGLGHELHACAVMEPVLNRGCGITRPWMGLCVDPLQPDDIRGAVAMYGGREPTGGRRLCSLSPRPPAPRALSARLTGAGSYTAALRWRNPAGVTLAPGPFDPYALAGRSTVQGYEVDGSRSGCPVPGHDLLRRAAARAGARMQVTVALAPGSWCLRVRIADAFRRWGSTATVRITVPVSGLPSPNFATDPAQPLAGAPTTFLDQSTAGSAPISAWQWSFGDGGTATGQNPQHTYATAGTYTVTLTVTDADGGSATLTRQIAVSP